MKKILIIPAIAALTLCACGGNSNSGSEANNAPTDTLAEYIAYQVFKQINPDSTVGLPDYKEDKLTYTAGFQINDEVCQYASVNCYPKKNGGYLAVYSVVECFELGDGGECETKAFKAFNYADGKISEDNTLLPKPTFDDFNKYEAVWFYNPNDKTLDSAKADFAQNGYRCSLYGKDIMMSVGQGDSFLRLFYKFNGENFEQGESQATDWSGGLITTNGLGKLRVGDVPPSQLAGFDINTMGRTMYFNRNAKKEFKISLSADGKIDTIIVVGKSYNYRYWCGGGYCYLMVGSDIDSEITENLPDFVYEDGHSCIKTDGSVVEFCCKPDNNTIESIKIYKESLSEPAEENGSWEPTPTATGDLNGDGIKDSAAFNNGFSVYFGSGDGKYNLFKKYKVYPHETNDYVSFTTSVKINNGKMIISTRREGDGWENYDYTAKFQDGDFVIVNLFCDEGLDGSTTEVLNFEEKTYKGDFDGYEEDSYSVTAKLKNLPLPKLSAIQIGGNSYEFFHKYIDESTSKTTTE